MISNQKKLNSSPRNDLPEDVSAAIRAARARYAREWREKNPEKQAAIVLRYWLKKARELQEQAESEGR